MNLSVKSMIAAAVVAAAVAAGVVAVSAEPKDGLPPAAADKADDRAGKKDKAEKADKSNHGAEVSEFARTTDLEGAAKGAAISKLASGGKSRAGKH